MAVSSACSQALTTWVSAYTQTNPSESETFHITMAGSSGGLYHLQFDRPLNWKAGRQIPVNDLLKRLSSLGNELKSIGQEEFVTETLSTTAKELASTQLIAHKDRGVRAWTAHCLVDVLRLYAPDAPYTTPELKVRRPTVISPVVLTEFRKSTRYLLTQSSITLQTQPIPTTVSIFM